VTERPVMLVTGSSRGIGLGIAKHFVSAGYDVHGCSRGSTEWESEWYQHTVLDVSDEQSVTRWVRQARSRWKRIDALVCNAAFAPATHPLSLTNTDIWQQVLRTNIDGTFFACREVARTMTAQRSGRIVTLSSMAAALHIEGTAAYAASKSAIVEMTKVLARELAPAGVTCNVVGVSVVMTDTVTALGQAVTERALERLTFKRPLEVEEVCHVVEFFCSPASSAVTGQVLQLGLVT
jgi:3-oxoacyl-[acyl-carrier protein] reductase